MESTAANFKENALGALGDARLRDALDKLSGGFPENRRKAAERLPEFEALRDQARDIKHHVLENLDHYLEAFEARVVEAGGTVHWCRTAAEARTTILRLCKQAGAKTVTKSKSMIGEEIAINEHLEHHGVEPVETDLGEYIIQLRREPPSHIIAPAIHLSKEQIADTFREKHRDLLADRPLEEPRALLEEARGILREKFVAADVGLTGANMLIAETGSTVLVTNEGNADLTYSLPRVHIVLASLEKIVPTLEDATTILRVLARSATGQEMSVYNTFCTGPKRPGDLDGPEEFHVVLLDNGRTDMLGGEFHDMLRCIRCGACLNHCPIYKSVGGHAYGWVYSGPMGAVLIPNLIGMENAHDLPNASTLCGKCEEVCPVRIPLPRMLRAWRKRQFEAQNTSKAARAGLRFWAFFAGQPWLYRIFANLAVGALHKLSRGRGRFRRMAFLGGWTTLRDLPAPAGKTFISQWHGKKPSESGHE
ncbi:MAG: LutB/LldF family L-lactate oxidation iron-sulfur protein [Proteobacteria bacterium]|nr:LutB/LldF family L-lactate oxidation iron-sulfur protein [Pseudomonadota bacterium]MDA1021762.1 LutB/LldF family L-lactate oxidation iron-sulfur protein [Pseudomonadota bacterium]